MPRMPFGASAFERAAGDLPQTPVINAYAEEAPTEATGIALQSRPGLDDRDADMGSSVSALLKGDGVLSGALLGISGASICSGTTVLGTIAGSGASSIAGNEIGAVFARGAEARYYDGATLSTVAFPDSAGVTKVLQGAGRFIFLRAGSGKFYWTPALAATVDALDFATAESEPDRLLDGLFLDDTLILLGSETVEFWPNTNNNDLPFQPLEGAVLEKGIKATGCACVWDSTFAWVANDNSVRVGREMARISNAGLEEKIAVSGSARLWAFMLEGQEFLCVRIDGADYVIGNRNRLWSQFASYGETNWLPTCFAGDVFGCSDGRTAVFGEGYEDFGGPLERRFRAGFPINAGGVDVNSISLRVNPGQTAFLTGDYTEPQIEMRLSPDGGQTWDDWESVPLGEQGDYRLPVEWRSLGMASQPGLLAEFRVTDPVGFRASDCLINEGWGGR